MKAQYIIDCKGIPCQQFPDGKRSAGAIIEHPDAYRLVRLGVAIPADEECRIRANMTPERMAKAQDAQARATAGLLPEDFPAWEAGWMRGYNPDGSWKPGPHYDEYEEEEWEERKTQSSLYIP